MGLIPGSPVRIETIAEFVVAATLFGFNLAAASSFARVLFSMMVPPNEEGKMFAMYQVIDRSSSWIGPLASAFITNASHNQLCKVQFSYLLS